jgi:hypothetical protein
MRRKSNQLTADDVLRMFDQLSEEEKERCREVFLGEAKFVIDHLCQALNLSANVLRGTHEEKVKALAAYERMLPKPRYVERDAEVVRLKKENTKRTGGQIAKLVSQNPDWAIMENGKPLNGDAVNVILHRARIAGLLPKNT